jgi:hypothetical protein
LLFVDTLRINATIVTTTSTAITTAAVADTTTTASTATNAVLIATGTAAAVNLPLSKRAPEDEGCRKAEKRREIQCRVK